MGNEADMERSLKLFWALCPGLEPSTLRKLMSVFGSATDMHRASPEAWSGATRVHAVTVERMKRWRQRSLEELSRIVEGLAERNVQCIVSGDEWYPKQFYDLYDPPVAFFAKGQADLLRSLDVVSVVGTRRATSYGLEATKWIVSTAVQCRLIVCSGLALGIDTAAHASAIQNGGTTIAVLGSGIDICYPPSNRVLYQSIQDVGLLISEYRPGMPVAKFHFPERNRLISALGRALVVVQAGDKSGAIGTAEHAIELGRDVYAVPGPITSKSFRGTNRLLVDGAIPLLEPGDLVRNMGSDAGVMDKNGIHVPEHLRYVYDMLAEEGSLMAGQLSSLTSSPPSHIYAVLLELEVGGLVRRLSDGRYALTVPESSNVKSLNVES